VNRNKRSIALDIKQARDLEVLHALVDRADVFLTNNPRMRSLMAAGLDPEAARGRNPRLVYVAISGYGHSGPKAGRPGYDIIAQGEAGLMALTGPIDGGPTRFPTPMADISAGLYATIGILAALYGRDRRGGTGVGDFLDIALVDAQLTWLANLAGSYFATGQRPARLGEAHPTVTPYQPVRARDKLMVVAVGTERLWQRFCAVLGVDETLRDDARFKTNADRNRNRAQLIPLLERVLGERDADDWVEALVAAGVPAGPINFPDHILADPHVAARKLIVELEHPLLGIVRSIGVPVQFAGGGVSYRRHPPLLDEHGGEIRTELGAQTTQTR
jgi:crotonobetainyl-CoA:carnitine CoA-transferase CaiB-like acyl-CoA transferase